METLLQWDFIRDKDVLQPFLARRKERDWREQQWYLPKDKEHLSKAGLKKNHSYALKAVSADTCDRAQPLFPAHSKVSPLSQGSSVTFPLLVLRVLVGDSSK